MNSEITWTVREDLASEVVDRKSCVKITATKREKSGTTKARMNLTIPDSLMNEFGLKVGDHVAVAMVGRKVGIKKHKQGFRISKVGIGTGDNGFGRVNLSFPDAATLPEPGAWVFTRLVEKQDITVESGVIWFNLED